MVEMNQATPAERRSSRRVTVRTEVIREGKPSVSFGRGENLSEGGMMLVSAETFPVDSVVKVRFTLSDPGPAVVVTSEAKVAWTKPGGGIGLQFLEMKDEFRQAIIQFVEAN